MHGVKSSHGNLFPIHIAFTKSLVYIQAMSNIYLLALIYRELSMMLLT